MDLVSKKRVGILRGGDEAHYDASLRHGGDVLAHIFENLSDTYKTVDILVDKDGVWHANGMPILPSALVHKVDVVWNTGHPSLGQVVQHFSIPVVSVSSFSSNLANNRSMLEEHMRGIGIEMPRHIPSPKNAREVFNKFPAPWIVRIILPDSNIVNVQVVKTLPELDSVIEDAALNNKNILVEEFITGLVGAVHSVRGFRGQDIYTFPPENLKADEKEKLMNVAKILHEYLGAQPYLKSNFILAPRGKVYLTGILFTPNLKDGSHFSRSCEYVGAEMHHVIEHILEQARQ